MLLEEFFEKFFRPLRLRSRSQRTITLYRTTLRRLNHFLGRPATLDDLNDLTISAFLVAVREAGRSPNTVEKERANVLAIWRWANHQRYVDRWPNVEREKCPRRAAVAWRQSEIDQLFSAIGRMRGKIGPVDESLWWAALHMLLWDTGERITAIFDLVWEDVDLDARAIICRAETRKGGLEDRVYRISPESVAMLRNMPRAEARVFPWPYTRTYLWNKYTWLLMSAGLPHDERSKFHRMRRSVASHYEAAGGNATELLGHSSRSVTRRYIDPRIAGAVEPHEMLFRPKLPEWMSKKFFR